MNRKLLTRIGFVVALLGVLGMYFFVLVTSFGINLVKLNPFNEDNQIAKENIGKLEDEQEPLNSAKGTRLCKDLVNTETFFDKYPDNYTPWGINHTESILGEERFIVKDNQLSMIFTVGDQRRDVQACEYVIIPDMSQTALKDIYTTADFRSFIPAASAVYFDSNEGAALYNLSTDVIYNEEVLTAPQAYTEFFALDSYAYLVSIPDYMQGCTEDDEGCSLWGDKELRQMYFENPLTIVRSDGKVATIKYTDSTMGTRFLITRDYNYEKEAVFIDYEFPYKVVAEYSLETLFK